MSSSLYFFDLNRHSLPSPTSFEDLESLRETLHAKPAGKNLRFIEFALRFEEKFPQRPEGTRSPLDRAKGVRSAAWRFDLPAIDTMIAYRAAVEIAANLDLVAYDAALGVGFLPDGRVIPEGFGQSGTPPPDDQLRGESEVRAVLAPALAAATAPHGFVLEPEQTGHLVTIVLTRMFGPVHQRLYVAMYRYEQVTIALQVQHEACAAIYEAALGPDEGVHYAFDLDASFFALGPDSLHRWFLERRSQLGPILEMVRDKLLPLADLCLDLAGIDQLLNDVSAETIRTPYKTAYSWMGRPHGSDGSRSLREETLERTQRLVVAHLNRNPAAPRIANWFDEHLGADKPARQREALLKLRETLAATAPLATWPDEQAHAASMRPIPLLLQQRKAVDPRERRCHHWEVSEELHQAASNDPAQFWERFANADGPSRLHRLWREKAETLPAPERIDPTGLACEVKTIQRAQGDDIQVVLIKFPPIRGLNEVAMLALARIGDVYRRYKMGYDHTLNEEGAIRTYIVYLKKAVLPQETLPGLLNREEFLGFVGDTIE